MIGRRLGPYKILRSLGSGGMGEVYEAEDTRLNRRVALKMLSAEFAEDADRRRRFEREAKAVAALDHPNIVTVHSIEECDGVHLISMQLVEGRTLSEVIPAGGLSLDRFLKLAVRLVDAVAAAHQKGVVHRDLKPTNVMVTDDGRVKVLDFGLAKLAPDRPPFDQTAAGTLGLTDEGQIVGTVAYMSPEQAQGLSTDHRSDIFSLGVLLYEMATGEIPFKGDTPVSVMSSILKETPRPLTELRPSLPRHLARIIKLCLAKTPDRRFQSALDVRNALDEFKAEVESGEIELKAPQVAELEKASWVLSMPLAWGAGVAMITVLAALSGYWMGQRSTVDVPAEAEVTVRPHSLMDTIRLPSQARLNGSPSWSPDGAGIAYASNQSGSMDIWMWTESGPGVRLTDTPEHEVEPAFSPDGRTIAFAQSSDPGGIFVIPAEGGIPKQISGFGARPSFSPVQGANEIVFDWRGAVYLVSVGGGGEPRELVAATTGTPHPTFAHDGERIYFWNRRAGDVQMVPAQGGEPESLGLVPTGEEVSGISSSPNDGDLILSRGPFGGNKNLWRVPLDPGTGRPAGDPARLTLSTTDDADPAVAPDGRLAFVSRQVSRHLWEVPLDPASGTADGEPRQLTFDADKNYYPALSPDGGILAWTAHVTDQGLLYYRHLDHAEVNKATSKWGDHREIGITFAPNGEQVAFSSTVDDTYELWRALCVGGCVELKLTETQHPQRDVLAAWSPSTSDPALAFYSNRAGNWDIWTLRLEAGALPRQLTETASNEMYPAWSPDGERVAFRTDRDGQADIWVVDPDGGDPGPVVTGPAEEGWSSWSPDGRWFYFSSDRSGSFNVWVQPGSGDGEAMRVTSYESLTHGLPETALYTKFAVSSHRLIVPLETRRADIWIQRSDSEPRATAPDGG